MTASKPAASSPTNRDSPCRNTPSMVLRLKGRVRAVVITIISDFLLETMGFGDVSVPFLISLCVAIYLRGVNCKPLICMDCMSRKHRLQCNIEIPAEPAIRYFLDFIPRYDRNKVNSL